MISKKKGLLIIGVLLSLFFMQGAFAWFNDSYVYREVLSVTNNDDREHNLMTVFANVTIPKSQVNANFSDILTTFLNGTDEVQVPYCFGSRTDFCFSNATTNTSDASNYYVQMHILLPNITASGQATLYVYHGNATVNFNNYTNNASATFIYFDEYTSNTLNNHNYRQIIGTGGSVNDWTVDTISKSINYTLTSRGSIITKNKTPFNETWNIDYYASSNGTGVNPRIGGIGYIGSDGQYGAINFYTSGSGAKQNSANTTNLAGIVNIGSVATKTRYNATYNMTHIEIRRLDTNVVIGLYSLSGGINHTLIGIGPYSEGSGATSEAPTQHYRMVAYVTTQNEPTIEQTSSAVITIHSPQNITYYGITSTDLIFSAVSQTNTTFSVNVTYDGTLIYTNHSYMNGTNITINQAVTGGSHGFIVTVNDSAGVSTASRYFYNVLGLNITTLNINGSEIFNWNLYANNGTHNYTLLNQNNTKLVEWSDLPQGSVNITINSTEFFDNETRTFSINNTMGIINTTFYLYRMQLFQARNSETLATINNFNITFSNGTASYQALTTDGRLEASLRNIPLSVSVPLTNLTITANGFNQTTDNINFNLSSVVNKTYDLIPAGLFITVFDERNNSLQLYFNIVLSNGTCSVTQNSIIEFSDTPENLCLGLNTITISNNSYIEGATEYTYPARVYFATISNTTKTTLTAYLLREDQGINHRFIVTDFAGIPIEDATISIRKSINGTFTPTAQGQTDTAGSVTIFMDPSVTYQVVVEADGYVSATFSLNPSNINTETYIKLQSTGQSGANIINITTVFANISYSITPLNTIQNGSFNITFFISDASASLQEFGLNITFRNVTNSTLIYNATSTSPSGATFVVTVDNGTGWYDVDAFFIKDGQETYLIPRVSYYITNGTGVSNFDPNNGIISINSFRLIAIFVVALSTAFFMRFGVLAGLGGGLSVMAIITFGFNIFPWQWFAMAFIMCLSLTIILRRF